jgi:hypothetical protein
MPHSLLWGSLLEKKQFIPVLQQLLIAGSNQPE